MGLPIKLPNKVTQFLGRTLLKAKKSSPEITIVTGIICGGAALVMVGVKTWKGKEKLSEDVKAITEAKEVVEKAKSGEDEEALKTSKKDLMVKRCALAKDICKTYWIPVLLGLGSGGLIWGGRTLLRKELSAVTSAYALLMESYKQYRQRVIDDVGIEKDQEYAHGIKMVECVDSETGEVTVKPMQNNKAISQYSAWWCEGEFDHTNGQWLWRNPYWKDRPYENYKTLTEVQNVANHLLKANGFLFLNKVYEMLGLPQTREGQIVGWTIDGGDGYVDFGVFPSKDRPINKILPVNRVFLDYKATDALLDFNVDGPILHILDKAYGKDYTDKLIATSL